MTPTFLLASPPARGFSRLAARLPAFAPPAPLPELVQPPRPFLLVEDNPNDVELALEALARCRLVNRIEVARDGVEALDYLHSRGAWRDRESGDPAVVLLDVKLPRVDGIGVLRHMRDDIALRQVPVVMLSASHEERDVLACQRLGIADFVVKPVDLSEFMAAMLSIGVRWGERRRSPPGADA